MYGFAKAAAVIEEGVKDRTGPARPKRPPTTGKPGETVTPGGVVLPTGAADPRR